MRDRIKKDIQLRSNGKIGQNLSSLLQMEKKKSKHKMDNRRFT